MAAGRANGGGFGETVKAFMDRRAQEIARTGQPAEAAAYRAYSDAIRAGRSLALRTQAEVMPSMLDQALAAARGGQDALTLGLGDRAYAGVRALMDAADGKPLDAAWRSRWADEQARDQYDAQHFRVARSAGEIAGTGLGLLAMGPLDGVLAGGARIAQATPMVARELAVLGAGGAGGGVALQAGADVLRGRPSSPGDYVASAAGGAVTAVGLLRGRPSQAAAAGGATTAIVSDLLAGRQVDWEAAGQTALASAYLAGAAGYLGRAYADGLSIAEKGKLGEALGRFRTRATFREPGPFQKRLPLEGGGHSVLDEGVPGGLMREQKFGPGARLSAAQRRALEQFPEQYRVDHFLPRDFGGAIAFPFAEIGAQSVDRHDLN